MQWFYKKEDNNKIVLEILITTVSHFINKVKILSLDLESKYL